MNNSISDIEDSPETQENELGATGSDARWLQVKSEWNAPVEKRALLVRSMTTITAQMVELATDVAKRYGLPISGVNIIPSKAGPRPYINSDGIRWRLYMDTREFKSSSGRITHMPSDPEPWITAYGKVEMKDGSWADNESVKEWPIVDKNDKDRSFTLGNMCKKLITQAKRRAGADLVGVGLPIYDEYYDQVSVEIIEGEYQEIEAPKKTEPTNLAELISMAKEQYNIDYEDLPAMMGVASVSDLNIKETWDKIRSTDEATVSGQESET
jgi:hypothetical protein